MEGTKMAYSWKKKNYKLTKEQKERGVIFSSQLIKDGEPGKLHEVTIDMKDKTEQIDNLKDVSFFKSLARDFGCRVELIERS